MYLNVEFDPLTEPGASSKNLFWNNALYAFGILLPRLFNRNLFPKFKGFEDRTRNKGYAYQDIYYGSDRKTDAPSLKSFTNF